MEDQALRGSGLFSRASSPSSRVWYESASPIFISFHRLRCAAAAWVFVPHSRMDSGFAVLCARSRTGPGPRIFFSFFYIIPKTFSRVDSGMRSEILPLDDFGCRDFFFLFTARGCISRLGLRFVPPRRVCSVKSKIPGIARNQARRGILVSFPLFLARPFAWQCFSLSEDRKGDSFLEIFFSSLHFGAPTRRCSLRPPAAGRTDCLSLQPCVFSVYRAMTCLNFFFVFSVVALFHSVTRWFGLHRRIRQWRQRQSAAR